MNYINKLRTKVEFAALMEKRVQSWIISTTIHHSFANVSEPAYRQCAFGTKYE